MKKYCFAYQNVLGGFYGTPFFVDHSKEEFVGLFTQSLYSADLKTLSSLKEDDLYYLGYFDNVTGSFVSEVEFVAHLSELVTEIIAKKSQVEKEEKVDEIGC